MARVELVGVGKRFGDHAAMEDVSLAIASGSFLTLLGPSGCGKTTTLRSIAGLATPDCGVIRIDGEDVTQLPVHRRNLAMVFQSHALFPHMKVIDNVAFGLRMRGVSTRDRHEAAARALALVRLQGFERRWPHELSGGQQQRVALARALVVNPRVLLLDEPFGALDRKLREAMQSELRELARGLGITAIFVTHDQEEALLLSDAIAVMNAGRIEQLGTPGEIFERPATRFVADFMGVDNIVELAVTRGPDGYPVAALGGTTLDLPDDYRAARALLALRPERLALDAPGKGIAAVIEGAVYLGAQSSYRCRMTAGEGVLVVREANAPGGSGGTRLSVGDAVGVIVPRTAIHVLRG